MILPLIRSRLWTVRHRTLRQVVGALLVAAVVTATVAGTVHADEETIPPTPQELADEQIRQALVDAIGGYADTGVWDTARLEQLAPGYCDQNEVSCTVPPASKLLNVYARQQINGTYCGPASAQAVINFTRGLFYSTLDGEDAAKNWMKQSVIGSGMGTDAVGSSTSYMIRNYLNGKKRNGDPVNSARNPQGFTWLRSVNDSGEQMYNRIVSNVSHWSLPLVLAVHPHKSGQSFHLPSWPNAHTTSGHFIAIRGYSGFWNDSDTGVTVYYVDSSGNGGQLPGRWDVGAWTMWKVNSLNGKTIVW
jgi:hypothetical protein